MARKKKSEPESNGSTALLDPPVEATAPEDIQSVADERHGESASADLAAAAPVEPKTIEQVATKFNVPVEKLVEPAKAVPSDRERELEEWRNKVVANAEVVEERNKVWKQLAVETKEARESWEQAVSYGQAFIRTMPVHLPLFDPPVNPNESVNGEAEKPRKAKKGKATKEPLPIGDEAWRSVSIDTLELSAGLCSKLVDAGLGTIGALADWTKGGKLTTDIPGIGSASAGAIDAATDKFWTDRRSAEVAALRVKEQEAKAAPSFDLAALRLKHVSELPLSREITDYLAHVGITTVGSLADWPEKTGKDYTQMNGVAGPNGADIASAVAVFLTPPVADEPATEAAPLEAVA